MPAFDRSRPFSRAAQERPPLETAGAGRWGEAFAQPATEVGRTDPVRWDLVRRVRRELARGELDTPEKWDVILNRLLSDLRR